MKKVLFLPLFCLALTGCAAALGAQAAVEGDPIVPGGEVVSPAIEAEDAVPNVPFTAVEMYYDPQSGQLYERGSAVPAQGDVLLVPGDDEITYQQAANLADEVRVALDWPAPAEAQPWTLVYARADNGCGVFKAVFTLDQGGQNVYGLDLDSVTGATMGAYVWDLPLNQTPFDGFSDGTLTADDYAAAVAAYNAMLDAADSDTAAAKAAASLAALGYPDAAVDAAPLGELAPLPDTLDRARELYKDGARLPGSYAFLFGAVLADGRQARVGYSCAQEYLTEFTILQTATEEPDS